jgi:FtsP/CotA-like multicopper oxidase with cupredoxin domain
MTRSPLALTRRAALALPLVLAAPRAFGQAQPVTEIGPLTLADGAPAEPAAAPLVGFGPRPALIRLAQGAAARVTLNNPRGAGVRLVLGGVTGEPALFDVAPGGAVAPGFAASDAGTLLVQARPADGLNAAAVLIAVDAGPPDTDLPVLIQEIDLDAQGRQTALPAARALGLVNGRIEAEALARPGERVRLRIGSAARRRLAAIRVEGAPATVVAIDSQPASPFGLGQAVLAPGSRIDLVIDMPPAPGLVTLQVALQQAEPTRLVLRAGGEPVTGPTLPAPELAANDRLPARMDFRRAERATLDIAQPPAEGTTVLKVARGRTVQMAFTNGGEGFASVAMTGHPARLLDGLDDGWKPYWVDTFPVGPRQTQRIAFVAQAKGLWPLRIVPTKADQPERVLTYEVI